MNLDLVFPNSATSPFYLTLRCKMAAGSLHALLFTRHCRSKSYRKTPTKDLLDQTDFFLAGFFAPPFHTPESKYGPQNKYVHRR